MSSAALPSKPHYPILDGLRGVASILVVLMHICEAHSTSSLDMLLNHGYLAVDFFFLLSGFVIGYAYDDRWSKMTLGGFFKRRLIRLQPMVVMGSVIGAIFFYFQDSTIWPTIHTVPVPKMLLIMVIGATLIPIPTSMDIRGWQERHAGQARHDKMRLVQAISCLESQGRRFYGRTTRERIVMDRSVIEAIGNTPLIRLNKASEATGCEILGKAEFMNPGQSVKDRAGLFIIRDAEKRGLLNPGGVIVEGTAGNTGIGLTLVAKALGYRTVIVIPETQSQEKKDALRLLGAELIEIPAVPYRNPNNYVKLSGRLAAQMARSEPEGAIWANQFDNVANRDGHVVTTAREIWEQTGGRIDGFVSAVGSGGTLAGVAAGLRGHSKDVKIALADPLGAALYSFYTDGELKSEGSSITEGIGQGRITANLEGFQPDFAYQIPDDEALPIIFDLVQEEGLCLGGSTGINIAGAIRLARDLGPGHTIVTVLCDYGTRYQSKLFNPEFLRGKGLPVPGWMEAKPEIDVPFEQVD